MSGFEELDEMKNKQTVRQFEMTARHVDEHHSEKEILRASHEAIKLQKLQDNYSKDLKLLQSEHRIMLRQLRLKQGQELVRFSGSSTSGFASTGNANYYPSINTASQSKAGLKGNSSTHSRALTRSSSSDVALADDYVHNSHLAEKPHVTSSKTAASQKNLGINVALQMIDTMHTGIIDQTIIQNVSKTS